MDALLKQLQALADGAPAELVPTAKTILVVRSTLFLRLETPATMAGKLRSFAAEDLRAADRLGTLTTTAELYRRAAALKEQAADLIEPPARAEVA